MTMESNTEERAVVINSIPIQYLLERKNVKNLNLRIRRDGSVYVSASPDVSVEKTDQFVTEKTEFILTCTCGTIEV